MKKSVLLLLTCLMLLCHSLHNLREQRANIPFLDFATDIIASEKASVPPCILDSTNGVTYFIADNGKRYPLDKYFKSRIENVDWETKDVDDILQWSQISSHIDYQMINDSLLQCIVSCVDSCVSALLNKEKQLTDSLIAVKHTFLRYQDERYDHLTDHNIWKHIELTIEMDTIRRDHLQELYTALSTGNYLPKRQYKVIPQKQFAKAYSDMNKNICSLNHADFILYGRELVDKVDPVLSRVVLYRERQVWNELLSVRSKISQLLRGNPKKAFDNGTRRLEWHQLIQLKNEYSAYGLISHQQYWCCLCDTDSYERVLRYSNFTDNWNYFFLNKYLSE